MPGTSTAGRRGQPSDQMLPPLNPFLGLLPAHMWGKMKDYFAYVVNFLPATKATTTTQSFQVNNDSDFLCVARVYTAFQTDNTTVLAAGSGVFLVTITDSGSGRQDTNAAVHIDNAFGTAQRPFILPFPKVWSAGATISIAVQNLSGATDYNVRLTFHGFKVFG